MRSARQLSLAQASPGARCLGCARREHDRRHDCQIPDALVLYRRHSGTATTSGGDDGSPLRRLAPHGQEYRDRADYVDQVRQHLATLPGAANPSLRPRLETAIGKVHDQAELLRLRAKRIRTPAETVFALLLAAHRRGRLFRRPQAGRSARPRRQGLPDSRLRPSRPAGRTDLGPRSKSREAQGFR